MVDKEVTTTSIGTMRINQDELISKVEKAIINELNNEWNALTDTIKQEYILPEFTAISDFMYREILEHQKVSSPKKKPVIYLYPEFKQQVNVKIGSGVQKTCTYPEYGENGWVVTAYPDGTLIDPTTGKSYYCLFWEGFTNNNIEIASGFVVKGNNTSAFLEDSLKKLGLSEREANEFIIYWLPQMEKNKYNLIHFATKEYEKMVPLEISPKPDSVIRVLMIFKPISEPVNVKEQTLETIERKGFTVVEWGGTEIK